MYCRRKLWIQVRILALTLFLKFKHLFIDAYVMRNGLVKTALNEFLISAFAKMVALAQPWKTLINANVRMVLSVNFVSTSVDLPINQCHRFFHGEFLIWNVLLTTVKMSLPQLNNKFTNLLSGLLPEIWRCWKKWWCIFKWKTKLLPMFSWIWRKGMSIECGYSLLFLSKSSKSVILKWQWRQNYLYSSTIITTTKYL